VCYSAQIWADFRKYERFGGTLDITAFVKLFWERKRAGDWVRKVPRAMRDSFAQPRNAAEREAGEIAIAAYRDAALALEGEIATQTERLVRAQADPPQDLLLACLWRYAEPEGDEPGFYSFAAITRDPPPEVHEAGHDRCVIPIRPEHLDAWLDPDPKNLAASYAILDDPIDAYYQHELVEKEGAETP
jgi:hypothetical protein